MNVRSKIPLLLKRIKVEDSKIPVKRGPGRPPVYAGKKIMLLVTSNPRRVGSAAHTMFELYKDGMRVEEFITAGGSVAAIGRDVRDKFICVV